jgi:ribosomal protein S18 acetylase RimI-like enzyme
MLTLNFCVATADDAHSIVELVNAAYRGETSREGWTTEADLLEGRRTELEEISRLLYSNNAIILCCTTQNKIIGSICLTYSDSQVEMGMFAVNPLYQGQGIGKQLLQYAECYATQKWPIERYVLEVIHCRHELIAFYERRGYKLTSERREFPVNPVLWTPKVGGLVLLVLEKSFSFINITQN